MFTEAIKSKCVRRGGAIICSLNIKCWMDSGIGENGIGKICSLWGHDLKTDT